MPPTFAACAQNLLERQPGRAALPEALCQGPATPDLGDPLTGATGEGVATVPSMQCSPYPRGVPRWLRGSEVGWSEAMEDWVAVLEEL